MTEFLTMDEMSAYNQTQDLQSVHIGLNSYTGFPDPNTLNFHGESPN
jgi:hypothetical protein